MKQKYFRYINTLFIVFPMTLIMALVGTLRNNGLSEGWLIKLLKTWSIMFPVAYLSAFIIIPQARKLAEKVTEMNK